MRDQILEKWSTKMQVGQASMILPDGCCDVIISQSAGAAPKVFLSRLMQAPFVSRAAATQQMTGYRLKPAAVLNFTHLLESIRDLDPEEDLSDAIQNASTAQASVDEAIFCFQTQNGTVTEVCKDLGVRPRTLQRLFAANGLPSPVFWHQLARARRAGRDIVQGKTLCDTSFEAGYADQAHMSRAIRRLFGVTPKQLHARSDLARQFFQPGFATGEQISTKIPSISLT